ncbi:MAG TPA: hypothetical protein VN957_13455 [Chthoniobacterales bacterium]|nr:hypothetical protein [Chthoniobacterales bacterium]
MHTNLWLWIAFNAGVLCVLAIDLFGFQRKAHAPSTKEAAMWTAVWVALSVGFNSLIWYWEGHPKALEFLTGYMVEYSLSVDNIFVFVLVFSYFAVPAAYQHRVLFLGILSALILRGVMIGVGVALVERFHWVIYFFGAFLIFTGIKIGLRSLYFLLAGVVHKFVYLKPALAVILSLIGTKMLLVDLYHIPTAASLTVIGLVLLAAIGLSLLIDRRRQAAGGPAPKTNHDSLPVTNLR